MGQMRPIWAFTLPNSLTRRCSNKQMASSFGKLRSARSRCRIIALGFRLPIAGTQLTIFEPSPESNLSETELYT